jgi:hypothetical protein
MHGAWCGKNEKLYYSPIIIDGLGFFITLY